MIADGSRSATRAPARLARRPRLHEVGEHERPHLGRCPRGGDPHGRAGALEAAGELSGGGAPPGRRADGYDQHVAVVLPLPHANLPIPG